MSRTKAKQQERLREHAEFLWKQAQMRAALAKTEFDIAVEVFRDLNGEMTEEQIKATEEQIAIKERELEDFIMSERDLYLNRIANLNAKK